jgi:hypothetical protein
MTGGERDSRLPRTRKAERSSGRQLFSVTANGAEPLTHPGLSAPRLREETFRLATGPSYTIGSAPADAGTYRVTVSVPAAVASNTATLTVSS